MSRLRVRIELNRGGVGVPLDKLASVVQQAQSFFRMLGDDVHIDQSQGDWLGFDFDHESLNFTAEFVGAVTQEQVAAFHAAFDGTTPLRRATIAQFARIADAIEEDEVIGFGLYLNEGDDPGEWRCLSRRDALRIAEEIQVLLGAGQVGQISQDSHLPAAADVSTSARYLFGRRDRTVDAAKLTGTVREVEASLSKRIDRLEGEVADHSGHIHDLRSKSVEAEQSMGRLLSAVEGFCEQAALRLETVTVPALSAGAAASASAGRLPIEARVKLDDSSHAPAPASAPAVTPSLAPIAPPSAAASSITFASSPTVTPSPAITPTPTVIPTPTVTSFPTAASSSAVASAPATTSAPVTGSAPPTTTSIAAAPSNPASSHIPSPSALPNPSSNPVASMLTAAAASPLRTASPVMTAAPFKEKAPAAWWRSPVVVVVGVGTAVILIGLLLWPSGSNPSGTSASEPAHNTPVAVTPPPVTTPPIVAPAIAESSAPVKPAEVVSKPATKLAATTPAVEGSTRIELVASEPTWISIRGGDGTNQMAGLIEQGKTQSVDIREPAVLRAGNAGGLTIRANGKLLGPLGPHGVVRDVEFKDGGFKLIPITDQAASKDDTGK